MNTKHARRSAFFVPVLTVALLACHSPSGLEPDEPFTPTTIPFALGNQWVYSVIVVSRSDTSRAMDTVIVSEHLQQNGEDVWMLTHSLGRWLEEYAVRSDTVYSISGMSRTYYVSLADIAGAPNGWTQRADTVVTPAGIFAHCIGSSYVEFFGDGSSWFERTSILRPGIGILLEWSTVGSAAKREMPSCCGGTLTSRTLVSYSLSLKSGP